MGFGSCSLGTAARQSCAACCTCDSVGSSTGVQAQNDVLRTPSSSMRVSRGVAAAKRPHAWWPHGSARAPGSLHTLPWAFCAASLFRSTTAQALTVMPQHTCPCQVSVPQMQCIVNHATCCQMSRYQAMPV